MSRLMTPSGGDNPGGAAAQTAGRFGRPAAEPQHHQRQPGARRPAREALATSRPYRPGCASSPGARAEAPGTLALHRRFTRRAPSGSFIPEARLSSEGEPWPDPAAAAGRARPERLDRLPVAPVRPGRRLAGLVDEGVVGVTSNPTIFQAAIADGDAYDDQIRELVEAARPSPRRSSSRSRVTTSAPPATSCAPSGTTGDGKDGWVSLEVDPNLAHDTEGTIDEAKRLHALVDKPNLFIKIPATPGGPARDRGDDRRRHPRQRDADLLARAPPRGGRGVRPRPRSGWSTRRRPVQDRLRRVVLRLARRHRGRQAPRRDRRPRRAQGHAGDRQRQARLPDLRGDLLRVASGRSSRQGRHARSAACGRRPRPRTPSTAT